ncbi:TDRD5 protein, partial [Upupa epops]|nr:TDRD5 protein [Upupa epops]
MSKQKQLMDVLKKEVRSLLIAAKEGLTPVQLEQEYFAMVGKPFPWRDLGFRSTLELVADMPEVVRICPHRKGTLILKAIADEATKDVAKLVARQRYAKARKSAAVRTDTTSDSHNPQSLLQKGRASVWLPTVKAELQELLSSSPVLLSDFDKAFFKHFGRKFQYSQHGFLSLLEALSSVSDIIEVEQTSAGSLLTLKKYLASEIEKEQLRQAPSAVEMPSLEPICETENIHLTLEDVSEPVETQTVGLGDVICIVDVFLLPETGGGQTHTDLLCGFICHPDQVSVRSRDLECSLLEKLIMTPEIPPDAVQDRSLCGLPALERRCMVGVLVEFIVSPDQFYVNICSQETPSDLQDMMNEMRYLYSHKIVSDRYVMPVSSVRPGQLCCAMVANWWYRVIIHRVISDQEVEVFCADYGNLEVVHKSHLRFLKWCYLKLPAQAIPCSLAGVKSVEGVWSSAATLLFKELCGSKLLVGIVDAYVRGVLHLFLCDTSAKKDVYFHHVLTDRGHADICEENVPSQGFMKLNPSTLYVQPSGKQVHTELVESDPGLQQGSLDTASETASSKL